MAAFSEAHRGNEEKMMAPSAVQVAVRASLDGGPDGTVSRDYYGT